MSALAFKKLYEDAQRMVSTASPESGELPSLQRGVAQLRDESNHIINNFRKADINKQQHYSLLAQSGVDYVRLADNLNKLDAEKLLSPRVQVPYTSITKHIDDTCDREIQAALDFDLDSLPGAKVAIAKTASWTTKMKQQIDTWDVQAPVVSSSKEQIHAVAAVLDRINNHRLQGHATDAMRDVSTSMFSALKKPTTDVEEAQQCVDFIIARKAQCADDSVAVSLAWLEKEYMRYIDHFMLKNQVRTGTGRTVSERLTAFAKDVYIKRYAFASLQMELDIPIWALLYTYLRTGETASALQFVDSHRASFNRDFGQFADYFHEYMANRTQPLPREHANDVLSVYQQLIYSTSPSDPFKRIILKIMGRCVADATWPDVFTNDQDYIWLELTLVHGMSGSSDEDDERDDVYTLAAVQRIFIQNGSQRFDRNGSNPWAYFKYLMLTVQRERAIDYLYKHEQTRMAAVHYGIWLALHGLIEIVDNPLTETDGILDTSNSQPQVHVACMIRQFIKAAYLDRPAKEHTTPLALAALQYVYLLSFIPGSNMHELALLFVQDVVFWCGKPLELLGCVSPTLGRQKGPMDKYKALLDIHDEATYIERVLLPVARRFADKERHEEAIQLFEMADNYNEVLAILIKNLGDTLAKQLKAINTTEPWQENPQYVQQQYQQLHMWVAYADKALHHYHQHSHISRRIDSNKFQILTSLKLLPSVLDFYNKDRLEPAFQILQSTGLLPLAEQVDGAHVEWLVNQYAALANEPSITYVLAVLPDLVILAAKMLQRLWYQWAQQAPADMHLAMEARIRTLKQIMHHLLMFSGLMAAHIPSHVLEQVNAFEVQMVTDTEKRFL
ncbi:Nup93/Nic96-domain-containing protein [Gongronella butleri]|nr:Nup93/Nic96-domain-containing protein [Gongronella butleri]